MVDFDSARRSKRERFWVGEYGDLRNRCELVARRLDAAGALADAFDLRELLFAYGDTHRPETPKLHAIADRFLDEANYADEAMLRGEISEDECAWFTRRAHEGWMAVQTILHREADECEYVPPTVRVSCGSM